MRRFLLLAAAAATARAQLTEFSSHIVLDGFDIENFNRPNRFVPPPTYLHPSLHHKTFPGAGPAASYRGRSGAFSDELQPTESFRNVSDPQYEFGTLGGDDMGKAFA